MNPIEIKDLYSFTFYGGLKTKGRNVVFVKAKANEANNNYEYDLMLCKDGKITQLTDRKNVSSYTFEDKKTLWFTLPLKEDEKKTAFWRLPLKGGEAIVAEVIDQPGVQILDFINPDLMLLSIEQEPEDKHPHAEDYEVLAESPYYMNGQGFIAGKRTHYYLYERKTKALSDPITKDLRPDVFTVKDGKIYFAANEEKGAKQSFFSMSLYEYDPIAKTRTHLINTHMDLFNLDADENRLLFFASDGRQIGLNSNPKLYAFSLADKKIDLIADWHECLGNTVGTDCALLGGNATCMDKNRLCFTSTIVDHNNLFDIDGDALHQILEWPGTIHSFGFAKGVLYFIGARPGELQELYKMENGEVSQVSDFHPELKDKYIAQAKPIFYTGSQNSSQLGWVLYPNDFDPDKKYPAILDIHGGPKTVYGTIFYHEMQVWASHGYFVFFCNPFGSDGQGNEYADLRGKYGTDDYEDLMKFTDTVLGQVPQIDSKRVGVTGGSYGGFMTNWIITHTDRFKAAASQRSISNWLSFWGTSDIGPEFVVDQQACGLDNPEKLWWHSPMRTISTVKTPTLFIHSDEDYRCPIEQGYQMLNGLIQNGVDTKMVLFHKETHELSRSGKPVHRERRLEEITNWMDTYLKGIKNEA